MFRPTLIAIATLIAAPAAAQDIYVGAGYDYGFPHSGDAQSAGSVVAGVTFGKGAFSYGIEGDYGTGIGDDATRDTMRLRGMLGYDLGSITAFASLGATRYDVTDGATFDGYNVGLGAEMPVSGNISLRGEFIRDFMDDFGTDVTTTRIGVLYQF